MLEEAYNYYLLRNLAIVKPNHEWQTDITYIPLELGFIYMVAIIEVYSKKMLNRSNSNTRTVEWCAQMYQDNIDEFCCP